MATEVERGRRVRPRQPRTLAAGVFVPLATLFVAFVALPLGALIWRAARDPEFGDLVASSIVLDALRLSLLTSTLTLAIALLLGVPLAYLLARTRFPGKQLLDTLIDLPLVLPPTVAGVALLVAFGRRGVFGAQLNEVGVELAFTTAAVVLAQLFVSAPFLVRSLKAGFQTIDTHLEEASVALGASPWRTFWLVTLPLARPALLSGAVLCWVRALSELGATLIFAGSFQGRTQTMPLAIIAAFESSAGLSGAVALAVVLLAVAAVLLVLLRVVLKREAVAGP